MMGIWRRPVGVCRSGFPGRRWTDTPGKRAEGPGSPKRGKMEPEWSENEGWACSCGWSGSLGQPHNGHMPPLVMLAHWELIGDHT